jgi:hypothetical protein
MAVIHCLFAAIVTYPGRNDYVQGEGGEVRIHPIALDHFYPLEDIGKVAPL